MRAAGCRVIGFDLNSKRAALALQLGADAACDNAETFRNLLPGADGGRGAMQS